MARDGEPHARDGGSGDEAANAMKLLRQLIAGLAAITAFVYFAGGVVLGLRLAFARLPALGVVGQLPHDVLFAIGGSQVAIPALAFVAVHLAWRGTLAMQKNTDRPQRWHEVGRYRVPRARHVGFTAAMPVLLVLPGAALALASADDVPSQWPRLLVGVSLGGVLVGWGAVSWWSRLQETSDEVSTRWLRKKEGTDDSHVETEPKQRPADVALVFLGGAPFAIAGIAATLRTDDTRFLWLPAGWFVCLMFAMGYTFARAIAADHFRESHERVRPQLAMSCVVVLLAVPASVAFWAAWPLPAATVCTKSSNKPSTSRLRGVLIGESSDRVYIGDAAGPNRAISSVPTDNVAKVVFGDARRHVACTSG